MKKIVKWVGIVFLAFIALIAAVAFLGKGQTEQITIQNVDLQQVSDGTYIGTYSAFRFTNIVEVTVENHTITNIEVLKTQREDLSCKLAEEVISQQNPAVDTVSAATLDTKAFLKAIENALKQGVASNDSK